MRCQVSFNQRCQERGVLQALSWEEGLQQIRAHHQGQDMTPAKFQAADNSGVPVGLRMSIGLAGTWWGTLSLGWFWGVYRAEMCI